MSIGYEKYRDNLIRLGRWPKVGASMSALDMPAPSGARDRSKDEHMRVSQVQEVRYRAGLERPRYPVPCIRRDK